MRTPRRVRRIPLSHTLFRPPCFPDIFHKVNLFFETPAFCPYPGCHMPKKDYFCPVRDRQANRHPDAAPCHPAADRTPGDPCSCGQPPPPARRKCPGRGRSPGAGKPGKYPGRIPAETVKNYGKHEKICIPARGASFRRLQFRRRDHDHTDSGARRHDPRIHPGTGPVHQRARWPGSTMWHRRQTHGSYAGEPHRFE